LVVEEAMKRIADDEAMMIDELRYGFHQRFSSRSAVRKDSNVDPAQESKEKSKKSNEDNIKI